MGQQLQSAEFIYDDGITYCIRRETLEQDFTIYEKRGEEWIDCIGRAEKRGSDGYCMVPFGCLAVRL